MQLPKDIQYVIGSTLNDDKLQVTLTVYDIKENKKMIKLFNKVFTDQSLRQDIKKNFQDITNIYSILQQSSSSCKVDIECGVIILIYQVVFPNGKKFHLDGPLQLQQRSIPQEKLQITQNNKVQQKITKLQNDIKQLFNTYQSDSEHTKQFIKLQQTISEDIKQLKINIEHIWQWKNGQQAKYKQLEEQLNKNKAQSSKQKLAIPDEMMHIFDEKIEQFKQNNSLKLQKQAEKMQDMKDLIIQQKKMTQKLVQQNIQLRKLMRSLQQKATNLSQKTELHEQKLIQHKQVIKKVIKSVSDQKQQSEQIKAQLNSPKRQEKKSSQQEQILKNIFSPRNKSFRNPY